MSSITLANLNFVISERSYRSSNQAMTIHACLAILGSGQGRASICGRPPKYGNYCGYRKSQAAIEPLDTPLWPKAYRPESHNLTQVEELLTASEAYATRRLGQPFFVSGPADPPPVAVVEQAKNTGCPAILAIGAREGLVCGWRKTYGSHCGYHKGR